MLGSIRGRGDKKAAGSGRRGLHCFGWLLIFMVALATLVPPHLAIGKPAKQQLLSAGDILVTPPADDDVGYLLQSRFGLVQGADWTQVEYDDLAYADGYPLKGAKALFINSDSHVSGGDTHQAAWHLRSFVSEGGTLYVSGYSASFIPEFEAFPGYLVFSFYPNTFTGTGDPIPADIVDPGLRNYLFPGGTTSTIDLDFVGTGWPIITATLRSDVKVLARADLLTFGGVMGGVMLPDSPVAVVFPYGQGEVIYTSFYSYFYDRPYRQQTADELRFLDYLVLRTISGRSQRRYSRRCRREDSLKSARILVRSLRVVQLRAPIRPQVGAIWALA